MHILSSKLTAVFLTILLPLPVLSQHLMMHDRKFYKLPGQVLVGNVTATVKVKDTFDCTFLCLGHGPTACLSFNLGNIKDNGYYTCELSKSERYLVPQGIEERADFDYYGTNTEYILLLLPCTSSPCKNGGTCSHGSRLGEFFCHCGVEISVLPFLDNLCNVDPENITTYSPVQGVFRAQVGRYNLNYYDAQRLCEMLGATLATYNQLYAAWEAGIQECAYGWLADGTAVYPMQEKKPVCGDKIGIIGAYTQRDKNNGKFNAWCYKE